MSIQSAKNWVYCFIHFHTGGRLLKGLDSSYWWNEAWKTKTMFYSRNYGKFNLYIFYIENFKRFSIKEYRRKKRIRKLIRDCA